MSGEGGGGKARMGETPEGGAWMDNWGSSCGGPFKGCGGRQSGGIHPLTPFFHAARVVPGAFNPQHSTPSTFRLACKGACSFGF